MLSLILGAARSGKSKLAQKIACPYSRVTYIATAPVDTDPEMVSRIAKHRASRSSAWPTVEAPLHLANAVSRAVESSEAVLVDCLTLWLSNLFFAAAQESVRSELNHIAAAASGCRVILVSNEVGAGIVPDHPLSRDFRDAHGWMNQHAAELADEVILTVAGLPLHLKSAEAK